jgi:flavodoxin
MMLMAASCTQKESQKILVLYYSQTNTTKAVADYICDQLGADIEEITVVNPYDGSYQETIERCMKERQSGELPEINPIAAKLADYDVIFFGYPIWFGTCALPALSALKAVDFSGMTIVPFCTFGSGGLEEGIRDLKAAQPKANVLPGYGVRASRIDAMPAEVDRFLLENGFVDGEFEEYEAFSEVRPATEEEIAIFDAAVGTYPMIQAKASKVSSRPIPGGTEYIFEAAAPGNPAFGDAPSAMKIYVVDIKGQEPAFTRVVR